MLIWVCMARGGYAASLQFPARVVKMVGVGEDTFLSGLIGLRGDEVTAFTLFWSCFIKSL